MVMWLALVGFVVFGWPLLFVVGKAMLYATDEIDTAPIRDFLAIAVIAAFLLLAVGGATALTMTAAAHSF